MSPREWSQIRRSIEDSEYHAMRTPRPGQAPAIEAPNRKQAYRTAFHRDGIEIAPRSRSSTPWRLGLSLTGYGCEGDVRPVQPAEPRLDKDRIEYRRGRLNEWYVNRPEGLEQGFDLPDPGCRRAKPLVLSLAVQGDLDVSADGRSATFGRAREGPLVRYAGLKAWDAEGRLLPSRLQAVDREIHLVVEAQAARFPVTVDPIFIHEAQLFGQTDGFGYSVSVSADTAVVGATGDFFSIVGAAYVFVRSGTTWTQQQKLMASDGEPSDEFGISVSISGDTVVVGAHLDNTSAGDDAGSAYVFVRSGTTWSQQQKLVASPGAWYEHFGNSVSVSGDTVMVGAPVTFCLGPGSAYVFVRSGTTWTEQQRLTASAATEDCFGASASLDGDTVVIGASADGTGGVDAGSAYVFVRSGTTWTERQKLTASDGVADDRFGWSVSLSGSTALIGADLDDTPAGEYAGSAYVFVRSGTTWTEQQKLMASDGVAWDFFGSSVSISGDTLVVASPAYNTLGAGSAYVFVRSGTIWTEQQKLTVPGHGFGNAVALSGDTALVGAVYDDVPGNPGGSAHVFREVPAEADLAMAKTDGQATAVPGEPVTYTITVSNGGPSTVPGASVTDLVPPAVLGPSWTCSASPGSSCTAAGSGNINDTITLLWNGTATYTLTGTVDPAATGSLSNTATVSPPGGVPDPNPANNSATDVDVLTPEADLAIAKTDSADPVSLGDPLTYDLTIITNGPSVATGVTITDTLPPGVTFVSSVPGPPQCSLAGATLTCDLGTLPAGATSTVAINTTVNSTGGMLVNTASVSANGADPDPTNNAATAATYVGLTDGELAHGTRVLHDLAAQPGPVPDEDIFRINQQPYSSYEIVIDATSGDVGVGTGPSLQRVAPDGTTVVQDSAAVGSGPSRSLRWRNSTPAEVETQTIRVRSAECGTDCGPDDVYQIRAYETTGSIPRFNNAGSQITVLILQNPTNYPITVDMYFWLTSAALVGTHSVTLSPNATLVLDTSNIPGANGVSGAITVTHDGRYGDLLGKTVALEPSTGFSFDSPLVPRIR